MATGGTEARGLGAIGAEEMCSLETHVLSETQAREAQGLCWRRKACVEDTSLQSLVLERQARVARRRLAAIATGARPLREAVVQQTNVIDSEVHGREAV